MPADLTNPFNESCCDGGACSTSKESAAYCGCDKGANWVCARHQEEMNLNTAIPLTTTQAFEANVTRHAKHDLDLNYAILALNGEAGECAEWHKKVNLRKAPTTLTDMDLAEELGDVLYYLTRAAMLKGWTLDQIMRWNTEKLDKRHGPKGV